MVDTNAAIYLLAGNARVKELLRGRGLIMSFVTEIELLAHPKLDRPSAVKSFIADCAVVGMDDAVKRHTIDLSRLYRFELSDAVVAATAMAYGLPLVTADREFQKAKDEFDLWLFRP